MALGKVAELGNFIREQRRTARLSLRKLSHMAGISNPYLSQIERGLRRPSAEILQAIAKALRVSAETMYVKAGILEEHHELDPVAALLNDLTITEKQKQALIEIYQSFRHENELGGTRPAPKPPEKRSAALAKRASVGTPKAKPKRAAPRAKKPTRTRTSRSAR